MNQEKGNPETTTGENAWKPASWQKFEAKQQATYPDEPALQKAIEDLADLPPLVTS